MAQGDASQAIDVVGVGIPLEAAAGADHGHHPGDVEDPEAATKTSAAVIETEEGREVEAEKEDVVEAGAAAPPDLVPLHSPLRPHHHAGSTVATTTAVAITAAETTNIIIEARRRRERDAAAAAAVAAAAALITRRERKRNKREKHESWRNYWKRTFLPQVPVLALVAAVAGQLIKKTLASTASSRRLSAISLRSASNSVRG